MDKTEDIPIANRRSTILGVVISFGVVAFITVALRLYTRLHVLRSPGWDDAAMLLALASIGVGAVFVIISVDAGLGQHFATLSNQQIQVYLFRFYVANGTYAIATTFIKQSLLLQYLRVYTSGTARKICIAFLVVISVWGLLFGFMAWFPCFPVRAYWVWGLPGAKCYAYGAKSEGPFSAIYESQSALNLVFDLAVLACALPMCLRNDRSRKEQWGIIALLFLGCWIIIISAWRLATIVQHHAGWQPNMDFTWYAPPSVVLSCVEVSSAIIAASCPIFWPVVESFSAIFVEQEIRITTHRRGEHNEMEIECAGLRSPSGSDASLRLKTSATWSVDYYSEAHALEHVTPFHKQMPVRPPASGRFDKL